MLPTFGAFGMQDVDKFKGVSRKGVVLGSSIKPSWA